MVVVAVVLLVAVAAVVLLVVVGVGQPLVGQVQGVVQEEGHQRTAGEVCLSKTMDSWLPSFFL